jgi:hypothetical protein
MRVVVAFIGGGGDDLSGSKGEMEEDVAEDAKTAARVSLTAVA